MFHQDLADLLAREAVLKHQLSVSRDAHQHLKEELRAEKDAHLKLQYLMADDDQLNKKRFAAQASSAQHRQRYI